MYDLMPVRPKRSSFVKFTDEMEQELSGWKRRSARFTGRSAGFSPRRDDLHASLPVHFTGVCTVAYQAATPSKCDARCHRGQPVLCTQINNAYFPIVVEQCIDMDQHSIGMLVQCLLKCGF